MIKTVPLQSLLATALTLNPVYLTQAHRDELMAVAAKREDSGPATAVIHIGRARLELHIFADSIPGRCIAIPVDTLDTDALAAASWGDLAAMANLAIRFEAKTLIIDGTAKRLEFAGVHGLKDYSLAMPAKVAEPA